MILKVARDICWLGSLGFSLIRERFIPEGDSGHPLFLARRDRISQAP